MNRILFERVAGSNPALGAMVIPGKALPRHEMVIAYDLFFWVVRVEFGLVPGDTGGFRV